MPTWFHASRKPARNVVHIVALIAAGLIPAASRGQNPVEGNPTLPPVLFADASDLIPFCRTTAATLYGAAWFDYDNDGWIDLFVPNDGPNALFRNNRDGTFTEVAAQAGLADAGPSAGAAAVDIDNDGDKDLFVSGTYGVRSAGPVKLYRNNGDGTFDDITRQSGIPRILGVTRREGGPDAGTAEPIEVGSISFADYDRDGFVDLFLGGSGDTNRLYRNNGDLTFTNVTPEAGVETAVGACGSVFFDYDDDGWLDIFVAGCNRPGPTVRNQLFHNNRDGTFTDVSAESGVGIIGDWMGVTAGDYDQDGDIDLFVTNVGLESCVAPGRMHCTATTVTEPSPTWESKPA